MVSTTTLYRRQRDRAIAYGTWESSIIPADHVVTHLQELVEAGRSRRWIAQQAGVTPSVVDRLLWGRATRISRHNAELLLAVPLTRKPTGKTYMSAVGARRRLEALATLGHSQADIAAATGLTEATLWNIRSRPKQVAARTHTTIARAYEQLKHQNRTDPTRQQVKTWARRKGFAPPRAWSRFTIDDPGANPMPTPNATNS